MQNYSSNYAGTTSRIGKSQFNNNILRTGSSDTTSAIGLDTEEIASDTTTYDDIDDFNGFSENFLGHKIYVNVKYISDEANYSDENLTFNYNYLSNTNNTNIKLITVWVKIGDTNITLRYPTCNIGASKYLSLEELSR